MLQQQVGESCQYNRAFGLPSLHVLLKQLYNQDEILKQVPEMCFSETGLVLSTFRIGNIILLGHAVAQLVEALC